LKQVVCSLTGQSPLDACGTSTLLAFGTRSGLDFKLCNGSPPFIR